MRQQLRQALVTLALTLLTLQGCQQSGQPAIRLGINPWPGYEFLYLAQEKDFFQKLGVNVKIVEYGSLNDVRRGYERGNLDAMASTLIEVLQVKYNSTREPMITMIADYSYGGDVIIARKDINNIAALKGKKVAADTTSLPIFILARALEKNGLKLSDIKVIPMEQLHMEKAFSDGAIDAMVTYPPVSIRMQQHDNMGIIFSSKEIPGEVVDVISVERSVLETRKDDIKKIFAAWDMALDYSKTNKQEAYAIMARREGISTDEFANALNDINIVSLSEQKKYFSQLKQILQHTRDILVETTALPPDIMANCCLAEGLH